MLKKLLFVLLFMTVTITTTFAGVIHTSYVRRRTVPNTAPTHLSVHYRPMTNACPVVPPYRCYSDCHRGRG
jgi:hypothetical protein